MNAITGAILFLSSFYAFLGRVCPTIYPDDSPETVTATVLLGITHPPGDPVLALAGKAWSMLPLGNMALRMNILSAFLASLALLLAFRLAVRLVPGRLPSLAAALASFTLFVFNPLLVQQAAIAKGAVYTLNMVLLLSAVASLAGKRLLPFALFMGLLASHHWMTFAAVSPVLGVWWLSVFFHLHSGKARAFIFSPLLFITGISPLVYLPIRASQDNFLSWGRPSTVQRLSAHYMRKVYLDEEMRGTPATWRNQAGKGISLVHGQVSWPGWILAVAGAAYLLKSSPLGLAVALSGLTVPLLISSFYLDLRPEIMHLLGIYLFPSWLAAAFLSILGATFLAGTGKISARTASLLLVAGIAASLIPDGRIHNVSRSTWSFDIGRALLSPLPPKSGLLVTSDLDTFPLWYFQAVEGYRSDVLVVNTTMMRHQWYREHIMDISGVDRLSLIGGRDASIRYLVFSSRRYWFSSAGDIIGVPPELPRTAFHLVYMLGGNRQVASLRGLPARIIFDNWARLPEETAALSLNYLTEVIQNTQNLARRGD